MYMYAQKSPESSKTASFVHVHQIGSLFVGVLAIFNVFSLQNNYLCQERPDKKKLTEQI